jgi:acyl-CoA thioesterase
MEPRDIVDKMMTGDAFSQWLGIEIKSSDSGRCALSMVTRSEMLNGFGILHGGITYSLADSALAFASNSQGRHAVSIDTGIAHLKKVGVGERLFAEAVELSLSNRVASYQVSVTNETGELVALFRGTVFRTEKAWE